ncbi:MAG: hypothetical protein ACK5NF_02185 [Bacilli bacterium]
METQEIEKDSSAQTFSDPVREGDKFVGWDKEFTNVTEDLVVTAVYEKMLH